MKNNIIYYYNIEVSNLVKNGNYYSFYFNGDRYEFNIYTRDFKEENDILKLNKFMVENNILVHEIIPNKNGNIVSVVDNVPYVLYKVYINKDKKITLDELTFMSQYDVVGVDSLKRNEWDTLWGTRIDYLEYQINQMGKKYPILVDSFSYFVGMAENAISYVKNTIIETKKEKLDKDVISHSKVYDSINSIYDPLNIIIDHKSRDVSEYIKASFFLNNKKIFEELDIYFSKNYYSFYGIRLLFGRVVYPSFYFDLYDNVILGNVKESEVLNITSRTVEYEAYLREIYYYLRKFYNIPMIDWLTNDK